MTKSVTKGLNSIKWPLSNVKAVRCNIKTKFWIQTILFNSLYLIFLTVCHMSQGKGQGQCHEPSRSVCCQSELIDSEILKTIFISYSPHLFIKYTIKINHIYKISVCLWREEFHWDNSWEMNSSILLWNGFIFIFRNRMNNCNKTFRRYVDGIFVLES